MKSGGSVVGSSVVEVRLSRTKGHLLKTVWDSDHPSQGTRTCEGVRCVEGRTLAEMEDETSVDQA